MTGPILMGIISNKTSKSDEGEEYLCGGCSANRVWCEPVSGGAGKMAPESCVERQRVDACGRTRYSAPELLLRLRPRP